jgi:hypothetical protein
MTVEKLKVENPCPVLLSRMAKDGQNYFCRSCAKTIVDFRDRTTEEIKCSVSKDTCGIFTIDQLQGQQKTTLFHQPLYYFLTLLSFFGFSVRPLNAQSASTKKDSVSVNIKTPAKDTVRNDKTIIEGNTLAPKKKRLFRKKQKYRVIGTPSF